MAEDSWDINDEYEKIFGSAKRVNLFETEEEYNELRQYIMSEPQVTYLTDKLPFEGIEISITKELPKRKRNSIKNSKIGEILSALIRKQQEIETPIKKQEPFKVEASKTAAKRVRVGRPPLYYYITRDNVGNRSCNAKGKYDKTNDKFIILAGSELAAEVTSSYRFSASDIKRTKFIQQYCGPTRYEHKLKKDGVCNSSDEAASFVLGENANGGIEWKSKEGISLESYISKV